ncbi:MAG: tetratricopeptide repeat protein [Gammaproteobacteria bacterium]|jgi:tetratricopeptide (TPR) repeat protein
MPPPVVSLLLVMFVWFGTCVAGVAAATENDEKTKKTVAMSQDVFEGLQEAQELIESKKYSNGHTLLKNLQAKPKLSVYESAQIWNLTAYAYYLQERYPDAITAYEKVLAAGDIPEAIVQSTLKTLSQLYFTIEDYAKALATVKRLMAVVPDPSADVFMLLGQAHFQLNQYKQAVQPISTAIEKYRAQGKKPRENWLLLLRVCYYEMKDYQRMIGVLKELIALYPKEQYLMTLAGVYSELGDTRKQLSLTEALYETGYVTEPHHVVNLANLYLLHGVPYKAAKVLQKEIDAKNVEANSRNLRLLSQAWYQAREDEKAIPPLARAAALAGDGELFVRLAQSYINLDRWEEAADAVQKGLDKGGVQRKDIANIMLGMALFNQRKLSSARGAFVNAAKDKRSVKVAQQWIVYVDSELKRKDTLDQTLPETEKREQDEILKNL